MIDRYQQDAEKKDAELTRLRTESQRSHTEAAVAKRELELLRQTHLELKEQVRLLEAEKRRLEGAVAVDQGKRQKLRGAYGVLSRSIGDTEDPKIGEALKELRESLMGGGS